ncbi:MAG: peptide chain release factor N(5)-glutamine methyltransferase [Candidatus Omnitrophota bacterium]
MNEIESIFCKLLHCDRSRLYLDQKNLFLDNGKFHRLQQILRKRVSGEPLQYLLHEANFMGLTLDVKPGVFIPRPETEILVEATLEMLRGHGSESGELNILDIGTGSGAIAIALAKFLKRARITALDISAQAISQAKKNAVRHRVAQKISFLLRDFPQEQHRTTDLVPFDAIVSNPPYISAQDHAHLPFDVQQEPREALVALQDGFYFYHLIERRSRVLLRSGGFIFLEIGDGQAGGIKDIFCDRALWKSVRFVKDYHEVDRVAVIQRA